MQTIDRDSASNRLTITLSGSFRDDEAERTSSEAIEAFRRMSPGFDLVLDMSDLEFSKGGVNDALARSKDALADAGVGRVVRVHGGSSLAAMRVARAGESNYRVTEVDTLEEAHAHLDQH